MLCASVRPTSQATDEAHVTRRCRLAATSCSYVSVRVDARLRAAVLRVARFPLPHACTHLTPHCCRAVLRQHNLPPRHQRFHDSGRRPDRHRHWCVSARAAGPRNPKARSLAFALSGGESVFGEPFKDEFHSRLHFNHRGQVAMANSKPNDNGSQASAFLELP